MSRVLVPAESREGDRFRVEGDAFHHAVRVLRVGDGDRLMVVDGSGVEYECVAQDLTAHGLIARIVRARRLPGGTRLSLRLHCALLKGDKLDLVLQKCTEMGVDAFGIFRAARSTVRIQPQDAEARCARWTRIVQSAVGQCGRPSVPDVKGPVDFETMLREAATADVALVPWEGDGVERLPRLSEVLQANTRATSVAVLIGPEGGFTSEEIASARDAGLLAVTLGPRILRAETAALVVPALVLAAFGDLG